MQNHLIVVNLIIIKILNHLMKDNISQFSFYNLDNRLKKRLNFYQILHLYLSRFSSHLFDSFFQFYHVLIQGIIHFLLRGCVG